MIRPLSLVAALVFAVCSMTEPALANVQAPAPQSAQPAAPPAKPVPAQLPDVLARVNGHTISRTDLENAVRQVEARVGRSVPPQQRDEIFRGLLDELIGYQLLLEEGTRRKIVVADAKVDERVADIRKQFPTEEAFKQTLEQRQMTPDGMRTEARNSLQIDGLLENEFAAHGAVTPQQVSEFYTGNPDTFKQGERAKASHILIKIPRNPDPATREQARARAGEALAEIKGGKDFATVARERSEDPGSLNNGGDLGYFERGEMVGPFEDAIFSLPLNELSDPVETQFGYHIIIVADRQPERTIPLDEVRDRIQTFLTNESHERLTQDLVDSLKMKGKIEIYI